METGGIVVKQHGMLYTLATKLDVAVLTFIVCYILGEVVRIYFTPKQVETELNKWRWKNTFVSCVHAGISGFTAFYWLVRLIYVHIFI